MKSITLGLAILALNLFVSAHAEACGTTRTYGSPISQAYGNCAAIGGEITGACTLMNPRTDYWVCPCNIRCGGYYGHELLLDQSAEQVFFTPAAE